MENVKSYKWCTKKICIFIFSAMLLAVSGNCMAQEFVALKIYPEHIGVFTSDGQQQFVAFGYTADGNRFNITTDVDWISSDENKVNIDKNGLAQIVGSVTSGQVKITCSYPKTGGNSPINQLLLSE